MRPSVSHSIYSIHLMSYFGKLNVESKKKKREKHRFSTKFGIKTKIKHYFFIIFCLQTTTAIKFEKIIKKRDNKHKNKTKDIDHITKYRKINRIIMQLNFYLFFF
jgi:hypothetical protein